MAFDPTFHTGMSPPITASEGNGGSVTATSSSGLKESPVAYARVGDARAAGVRPAVPVRSHLGVGMEQSMANHRGEMHKPLTLSSRARKGVGTAKAVADISTGSDDSDAVSIASSTNVELAQARNKFARARLDLLEAEASSSRRSHRSQTSKGSGTHVPTSAGPAAAPKGSLEAVPEASALRQDSVGRKPRLGQSTNNLGPVRRKPRLDPAFLRKQGLQLNPRTVSRTTRTWSTRTLSTWMPPQLTN